MKLEISRSFGTHVEKSARVLEVAEAFGLGLTDRRFVIYDRLEMEIRQGDICYISGESGSGKSLLLRDLSEKLSEAGKRVMDIMDVPLLDAPIVDQIGTTTDEALKLLSQAGLNDAYLFVRRPNELSDGQRYRFRLAKLIEAEAEVWVADEFAAVLDRQTAKVVAYNVAKAARKAQATLIVATTHVDLLPFLGATLAIEKLFGNRVDLQRLSWGGEFQMCQHEGCDQPAMKGAITCHEHVPPKPKKAPKPPKEPKPPKAPKPPKPPKPPKTPKPKKNLLSDLKRKSKPQSQTAPEAPGAILTPESSADE
jgi:uncharacterized protein